MNIESRLVFYLKLIAVCVGLTRSNRLRGLELEGMEIPEWDYTSESLTTPESWGTIYPECGHSERQSPINIDLEHSRTERLRQPVYEHWRARSDFRRWKIVNTGRYVEMSPVPAGSVVTTSRIAWQRPKTLIVDYVHFKWGDSCSGSEHSVNNYHFAAEMQVFHHTAGHRSSRHALAFLIKERATSKNGYWRKLLHEFSSVENARTKKNVHTGGDLLNRLLKDTYSRGPSTSYVRKRAVQYRGSLTIPPCSSNISWTVFITPIELSTSQLRYLRRMKKEDGNAIQCNVRPLQQNTNPKYYVERADDK